MWTNFRTRVCQKVGIETTQKVPWNMVCQTAHNWHLFGPLLASRIAQPPSAEVRLAFFDQFTKKSQNWIRSGSLWEAVGCCQCATQLRGPQEGLHKKQTVV